MKAIETRYLGPTDRRGSRIKATDSDGNSVIVPYDSGDSSDKNHLKAAVALIQKMHWKGTIQGGFTKTGMVWVFQDPTLLYAIQ